MATTKITAKVYKPLWMNFMQQADALFLKRDAFLNHMIRIETPHLARELKDKKLSSKARRYLSGELKRMGTETVNIVVEQETADALKQVVDSANLVRDGFINRLLMLLRSSDALLRSLNMPITLDGMQGLEGMPVSPLKAMEAVRDDPFYFIRSELETEDWGGLYTLYIRPPLTGLSCYLDDEHVPGTEAFKEDQAMLDLLSEAEDRAFGTNSKGDK
jgi:hypothetical protein